MGMCKGCGEVFSALEMIDGYCMPCRGENTISKEEYDEKIKLLEKDKHLINTIFTTTETFLQNKEYERIDVISAECIYGINIIKDLFSFIRDIVGGRIDSLEIALKNARISIIEDLKKEAFLKGANGIIGINIQHTYNNSGNGNILSVFGTGTAIYIKN